MQKCTVETYTIIIYHYNNHYNIVVCKIEFKIADVCYSEATTGRWLVESGQQGVSFDLYSIFKTF